MSRIPKWKFEKTKVKVVFRLQFHATHIPQPGWDKLFVSFIPTDSGKVTAKTTKASVRNGSCKWSDPIYETTRLLQDPKTKDYDDKLYKLVVAMGSSRSSLLGEVIINLADFVDALKPSSASLLLHGCDFGAILHVTVQLLTSKTGFREFEQQRELSVKGFQASSGKRIYDPNEVIPATSGSTERIDKVNARIRLKGDSTGLPSLEEVGEFDEDYEDLAAGADGSSYTESLYDLKNNFTGLTELDGLKSRASGDVVVFSPVHSSSTEKGEHDNKQLSTQLSNDWSHGWSSDYSIDNDLASTYDDSSRLAVRFQVAESAFLLLKSEVKLLQNISNEISSETQNLAQQLAMELSSGEKLAREVNMFKSEYWKFKNDLDELKVASASHNISRRKIPSAVQMKYFPAEASSGNKLVDSALDADCINLPCDFQSKLLQGIFLIEYKAQQIQNKASLMYNENEFDYIYSEFNVLAKLIQNIKQSITQELSVEHVSGIQTTKDKYTLVSLSEQHVQEQDAGRCFADLHYSEGIKEEKMCELLEKLEVTKTEDERFDKRMAKMECYYEGFVQELEDRQKQTSDQLENLRAEHSSCFYTISALQNQAEKLHEELSAQLRNFSEDRQNLESFIKELEKRAISSEAILKRVHWNSAIAVDRLQKDLELLSFQVLSMYESKESITKLAFADAIERHHDELSEEMHLWHRGEWLASPNQNQLKPALAKIPHDMTTGDLELSAILNGVSDKFNHRMLYNFASKEGNNGPSQNGLSMAIEFHVNEEPNASYNALNLHDISSASFIHDIMQERRESEFSHDALMEKRPSNCLQNLNVQKPINYSQISDNTENIKDVYHYPPPEKQLFDYRVGSKEIEMTLDVPRQLHVSSGAEVSDVLMLDMHWEVYAQVLQETLREVFPGISNMNGRVVELEEKMKCCLNDNEFLILKLHAALDESRILREDEAKCITRYNELVSKNHILEVKLNDALDENSFLAQKVVDCHSLIADSGVYESKYKACATKKNELENILKEEKSQRAHLQSKISTLFEEYKLLKEQYEKKCSLNFDLQKGATDLQGKLGELCNRITFCNHQISDSIFDDVSVEEELDSENYDAIISYLEQFQQKVSRRLLRLQQEKKVAEEQREAAQCTLNERESHILYMKGKFESELEAVMKKLEQSSTKVQHLQIELGDAVEKLNLSKEAEEWQRLENRKLLSNMSILEVELQRAIDEYGDLNQKLLAVEGANEELANTKSRLADLMQENSDLLSSIQFGNEASVNMEYELSSLKDSLHYAHDELQYERKIREELEVYIADLKLQMLEISQKLMSFDEKNAELCFLRTRVLDLERDLQQYVVFCKEKDKKIDAETSSLHLEVANMENHLVAALGHSISADVELTFMRNQFYSKAAAFVVHQKTLESNLEELHLKNLDIAISLEKYISREAELMAERERLTSSLLSAKSTLDVLFVEKERLLVLIDTNTANQAEFEDLKGKAAIFEANYAKEKQQYENEICILKSMRLEVLDELWLSKVELDIMVVFLRSNLTEQGTHLGLFEECEYELRKLREQHIELNQKLSEQIMKTEEFKNLSIHLRELKDKSDAECHQARERRESEGSSLAVQDSLRIAFIKEQYESKIQELRNQCSISRKYADEMLMKLQNSLDDSEKRKKNEASLANRNYEMSVLLSDLESELQIVVADRRELIKAYDRMKAELECTILSLECCREEKLKVKNSLKESCEEREKIRVELDLVKRLLENMASTTGSGLERNYEADNLDTRLIGELLEDGRPSISVMYDEASCALDICSEDHVAKGVRDLTVETVAFSPCKEVDDKQLTIINEDSYTSICKEENLKETSAERATLLENNATQIADIKEHFREQQRLMTGMELLHKQLQRLRNKNLSSDFGLEEYHFDTDLQVLHLHRELSQLDMANQQLGSIFPTYKTLANYGNALERVLALELELAEALQVKKGVGIQSSFLKQQYNDDDEAVFQGFKDINELIKDMLELKKRNVAVESELQEMHGRYSQLSLQFAEVEGERQKLVLSLKNRTPKKSS